MYLTEGYVLAVGLKQRCDALKDLPVRLCSVDTGFQALKQLRRQVPSVLLGLWDLPDMPAGALFKQILAGAASVATVTLVRFGDTGSEIAARSLGVTVVLDDSVDEHMLAELLNQLSARKVATGT
jgi:DNA-binding NarL/FixJ family response regulator